MKFLFIFCFSKAWSSPYVSPRLNRSNILLDSSDPREEMRVPTINYPSDHNLTDFGCQPSFSFSRTRLSSQFSPYASSRQMFNNRHSGYHSMDNSDDTHTSLFQANSPCCPTNIETNIELNTFEPPSFAKHLSHSPGSSKTSPVDDEIDVIHNSVKQESSPQPLIQSIREELMRLSNEKGERNSLRSRIVFSWNTWNAKYFYPINNFLCIWDVGGFFLTSHLDFFYVCIFYG